ncbi:hypothetical protein K0T92_14355 [Paenibacillus oenotherae]|uniref:Uncharacterized protein n=1 Tax=Paenibacillus oenotherae TaxID=1435645 RepID=A0ABS7D7K5_9BACL|nr:hypothetical protein [Paenibacillus oenotherae]MBW7475924.1 hypothetical protein [Paenibacillus oenotherae]
MAWIESHQELARHPKTRKLARKLGVSIPAAVGHLHFLWWWALDYAQDGDLTSFEPEDIAEAMEWPCDTAHDLITALVDSVFIDNEDGQLTLHDWYDYAGRLVDKREQNRERKRKSRAKKQDESESHAPVTRQSRGQTDDVSDGHGATEPNPTQPNRTVQNSKVRTAFEAYTSNPTLIESLESFIEFRKKIKKPMTEKAVTLLMGNLDKLASNDEDKVAILEQSILNGWQGVFALKGDTNQNRSRNQNGYSNKPQIQIVKPGSSSDLTPEEMENIRALARKLDGNKEREGHPG